jgi:hypothetical protein
MIITKGAAYDAAMTLKGICDGHPRDLPQTVSYRLAKIYEKVKKMGVEVEHVMIKTAQELGQEQHDAQGNSMGWSVSEAKRPEYNRLVGEYRDQPFELDAKPITIAAFGNSRNGLSVNEFLGLGPFVEGEVEETPSTMSTEHVH